MVKKTNKILKGERITLKLLSATIKNAEDVFSTVDNNREHLKPWFPWEAFTKAPEDSFKFLMSVEEDNKKGKKYQYGIYLGNEYIGNVGIFDVDQDDKKAEIGYWLSSKHLRKRYMTEAVGVLEKEVFNKLGINRMQLRCDEKNKGSAGVAKKCGYKLEGKMRQDAYNKATKKFRNTLVFSKLKSELK